MTSNNLHDNDEEPANPASRHSDSAANKGQRVMPPVDNDDAAADSPRQMNNRPYSGSRQYRAGQGERYGGQFAAPANDRSNAPMVTDAQVLDHARQLWREVEPEDRSYPAPHLDKSRVVGRGGAQLIAASRRGLSHAHDGKWREDAFALNASDEWLVVAVADGTGSKPMARVGSRIAARSAVRYITRCLDEDLAESEIADRLRGALAGAMPAALAAITNNAANTKQDVDDFATTLLLVAYRHRPGREWIGVGQIGDGLIAAQTASGPTVLGKADHGSFAGESLFLTSQESQLTWSNRVFSYQVHEPFTMLVVGSDGVMDDFSQPQGTLEQLFDELAPLRRKPGPNSDNWLLDWLRYERRGSFDDRTLVAILPTRHAS